MTLLHSRRVSAWFRGHLTCSVDDVRDRFALTFDDGPHPSCTPRILDLLAERGAHATFFMLAPNVRRHPELVRRIVREGHEPAVHGDQHVPLPLLLPGGIRGEIERCADAIVSACGERPVHYRPPFGFMMPGQAWFVRRLGYVPVLGDVYPEDPQRPGVERIVDRVMPRLTGGSILILHDGSPFAGADREQTVAALAVILAGAATRGLAAVTVRALLAMADAHASTAT